MSRSRLVVGLVGSALLIGICRILASYNLTAQTFDEPCHVAAAIELIDRGTYQLDPYNTPLARLSIGLPLYVSGLRMPYFAPDDPAGRNYNDVGNKILHSGNYQQNLKRARYGVLPFFVLSALIVFFWCRREFGDLAAVMAVFLFTTLPVILAFSSIAYSDMAAAFAQPAALFAFTLWLEKPSRKSAAWLGAATGLALLAKFTSLIYIPAGAASILAVRFLRSRKSASETPSITKLGLVYQTAVAAVLFAVVLWGGYRFSTGRVQESMGLSPATMPSFQHFPAPVRPMLRNMILWNPVLPAPGLLHGIAQAWAFNKQGPESYFMGQLKSGGWWYFFFVDLTLKSPLAFLLLSLVGFVMLPRNRTLNWAAFSPAAPIVAILLATTVTKVYSGARHVIALFPLLAIVAGYGAPYLWRIEGNRRLVARSLLIVLLGWHAASSVAANGDFLAYFNVLAGKDPSRILVAGCDLDCGQDLVRLSNELRARGVSHLTLAVWTSADMSKTDLPPFDVPAPYKPVAGWFAISVRALRQGSLFHESYPQNAFDWLKNYQPVQHVGKTVLLYYLPDPSDSHSNQSAGP